MNETANTSEASETTFQFFGLNGWAACRDGRTCSPQFRTEAEAREWFEANPR